MRILGFLLALATTATGLTTWSGPSLAGPPQQPQRAVPAYVRTPGIPLNVRTGPAVRYRLVDRIDNGRRVRVECQTQGQPIRSHRTVTNRWARLTSGGYVSAAYLSLRGRPATCRKAPDGERAQKTARVRTPGIPLNVRSGPATGHQITRRLPNGSRVGVECRALGQPIRSHRTATNTWAKLTRGGYASAAYLAMPRGVRECSPGNTAITGSGRAPTSQEFLRHASAAAQHSARRYRIPASVTVAQAMLESTWGQSALAVEGNNYFGIKCIGGTGPIAVGCRKYRTFECDRKRGCYRTYAWFRTYRSVRDSFTDHARLLTRAERYRPALRHFSRPNRFAIEVHRAGYATDPRYSRKLITLMRTYDLYRFD